MTTQTTSEGRSGCPITTALDIIGDRWTLVLMRDLVNGKTRFSQFLDSPEQISTNILSNRLTLIEASGLVTRHAYQQKPKRYEYRLTDKGRDLLPVMQSICRWGNKHYPDTWVPPESFMADPTKQ